MLQGTSADTTLHNWYNSTTVANIGLFKNVADSIDANPQQAKEVNEGISPDNHAEENEQAVYVLYFSLAGEQPDSAQHETLSDIAAENAVSGGGGVYMARAMIDTNADDVTGIASLRMIAPKQAVINHSGKLYPNPATKVVYFENNLSEKENGTLQLMDITGREMASYKLNKGNLLAIPTPYARGVYLVKINITGKPIETIKLILE
ncbi:MAG: T9SS type A sorting domain-containing protein [Bacteroidia bacterium]